MWKYSDNPGRLFYHDIAFHFELMVSILLHRLEHSPEERFFLEFESSSQQVQDSDVCWFEVGNIGVEVFIHVLKDAAVFEGEIADPADVINLLVHENLVVDSQRSEQDNCLSIQEASFVLVPVQNVKIFLCRLMSALVFYHTLSEMNRIIAESGVLDQNSLRSLIPDLKNRQVSDGQLQTYSFDQVRTDFANTVSKHVPFAGVIVLKIFFLNLFLFA
jgi:hypothetical protein